MAKTAGESAESTAIKSKHSEAQAGSHRRQVEIHRAVESRKSVPERIVHSPRPGETNLIPGKTEGKEIGRHAFVSRSDRIAEVRNARAARLESPEIPRVIEEKQTFKPAADRVAEIRAAKPELFEKRSEQQRLESAIRELKKMEHLQPKKWESSNVGIRRSVLERVGNTYTHSYDVPAPPTIDKEFPEYKDGILKGYYSDGDFEMDINKHLLEERDPRSALATFSHEYRHAYQMEMASRSEKPQFKNLVHDMESAREWSDNFKNYRKAEDGFAQYQNQPVERDARDFARRVLEALYET